MSTDENTGDTGDMTTEGPASQPTLTRFGELDDPQLESAFRSDRFIRELAVPLRWSAWATTAIYVAFAPVDWLIVPDQISMAWTLRYLVVVPIAVVLGVLTLTRYAERIHRPLGVIHALLGPFLFLTVGAHAEDPGGLLYIAWGAVLFPVLVPSITRMSVKLTAAVSVTIVLYLIGLVSVSTRSLPVSLFILLFYGVGTGYTIWAMYVREVADRRAFWQRRVIAWQLDELSVEREKSERLLLNVLPQSIADRLRGRDETIADTFEEVTVLFADIVGFTTYSAKVSAETLVSRLDAIFSRFDRRADELGLEKIKTIGDAYMVAGGLPERSANPTPAVARMALAMREELEAVNRESGEDFQIRVGMHTGPVVAGVIGRRKFIYDLWGDTVNTASRMESHGEPGHIQLSAATAKRLGDAFVTEPRGTIQVKGKGPMEVFWLRGEADEEAAPS